MTKRSHVQRPLIVPARLAEDGWWLVMPPQPRSEPRPADGAPDSKPGEEGRHERHDHYQYGRQRRAAG